LSRFVLTTKASTYGYGLPFKNSKSKILNFWVAAQAAFELINHSITEAKLKSLVGN
jgi:hypothetical protein